MMLQVVQSDFCAQHKERLVLCPHCKVPHCLVCWDRLDLFACGHPFPKRLIDLEECHIHGDECPSDTTQDAKLPLEVMVDARQDRIHKISVKSRPAKSARDAPTTQEDK